MVHAPYGPKAIGAGAHTIHRGIGRSKGASMVHAPYGPKSIEAGVVLEFWYHLTELLPGYSTSTCVDVPVIYTARADIVTGFRIASQTIQVQGSFVPFARVGSGDPVRVLRLFHNKYSGYSWIVYCRWLCTTCHYQSYVLTTTGCLWLCNSGLLTSWCSLFGVSWPTHLRYCTVPGLNSILLGPFTRITSQIKSSL